MVKLTHKKFSRKTKRSVKYSSSKRFLKNSILQKGGDLNLNIPSFEDYRKFLYIIKNYPIINFERPKHLNPTNSKKKPTLIRLPDKNEVYQLTNTITLEQAQIKILSLFKYADEINEQYNECNRSNISDICSFFKQINSEMVLFCNNMFEWFENYTIYIKNTLPSYTNLEESLKDLESYLNVNASSNRIRQIELENKKEIDSIVLFLYSFTVKNTDETKEEHKERIKLMEKNKALFLKEHTLLVKGTKDEMIKELSEDKERRRSKKSIYDGKTIVNFINNQKEKKNMVSEFRVKLSTLKNKVKNTVRRMSGKSIIQPQRTERLLLELLFTKDKGGFENNRYFKLFSDGLDYYEIDLDGNPIKFIGTIPINSISDITILNDKSTNFYPELIIKTKDKKFILSRKYQDNDIKSMLSNLNKWRVFINKLIQVKNTSEYYMGQNSINNEFGEAAALFDQNNNNPHPN